MIDPSTINDYEELPCVLLGLAANAGLYRLDDCPTNGSSDCPFTVSGANCTESYENLQEVLKYWRP